MINKKLFALINSEKKYIYFTAVFMIIRLFANIVFTASICFILYLSSRTTMIVDYIWPLIIALFSIIVRYFSVDFIYKYKEIIGKKVKKDIRLSIYRKIAALGVNSTKELGIAAIIQVAIEGVEQLDVYYSIYIPQFFYAMIAPIILFFITAWLDLTYSVILIGCVPLIPLSIIAVSKYAKKVFSKYWSQYTSMGDSFLDSVQGLKELKIFQYDEVQQKNINKSAEEFRKITMKVLVMQLFSTTIMDLIAYGGAASGIVVAIKSVIDLSISPFIGLFLILLSVEFFLPLRAFGSAFHIAMNGISAGEKILTLLNIPEPKWGNENVDSTKVELKNIYFSYDNKRNIIENVTMSFPEVGITSIVGESGCGKSTIANIIIGALRVDKGRVLVGDKDIEKLSRESYYSTIAVVSYDTYIFNCSIRENFLLANKDAIDKEMLDSLKSVNLLDFVIKNGGLDKVLSEDAINISGGQKQRLALAINLLAKKQIYIFDEATSNIDVESESIILKNIIQLSKTKSVIIISHKLANIINADQIYFMNKGRIIEKGTHKNLLEQNGRYTKLYQTQTNLEDTYRLGEII